MAAEKSSKRKDRYSSSSVSSQESSPVDKRPKNVSSSGESDDEVMTALNLSKGLSEKVDLILLKLNKLDLLEKKLDEVSTAVSSLKRSVAALETDVASVKEKQKLSEDNIKEIEKNLEFTSKRSDDFEKALAKEKESCEQEFSDVRKKVLYLEAYSRRENLRFEGIEEWPPHHEDVSWKEDTRTPLVYFFENVLGIEDAKDIEFQRIHRIGKPSQEGNSRAIIARFLRYSDRERVLSCGKKLKNTQYKMYEDIPRELQALRKPQIEKLKQARKEGRKAYFSKSEPDKLYIDGKFIKT